MMLWSVDHRAKVEFAHLATKSLEILPKKGPLSSKPSTPSNVWVKQPSPLLGLLIGVVAVSTASLFILLAFWLAGGFGWLDKFTRGLADSEIMAGLTFLGLLFIGQMLISLPFSIYDTFVIEEKYGFNKTTPMTGMIKAAGDT